MIRLDADDKAIVREIAQLFMAAATVAGKVDPAKVNSWSVSGQWANEIKLRINAMSGRLHGKYGQSGRRWLIQITEVVTGELCILEIWNCIRYAKARMANVPDVDGYIAAATLPGRERAVARVRHMANKLGIKKEMLDQVLNEQTVKDYKEFTKMVFKKRGRVSRDEARRAAIEYADKQIKAKENQPDW